MHPIHPKQCWINTKLAIDFVLSSCFYTSSWVFDLFYHDSIELYLRNVGIPCKSQFVLCLSPIILYFFPSFLYSLITSFPDYLKSVSPTRDVINCEIFMKIYGHKRGHGQNNYKLVTDERISTSYSFSWFLHCNPWSRKSCPVS